MVLSVSCLYLGSWSGWWGRKIALISLKWASVCLHRQYEMESWSSSVGCQNRLLNPSLPYLGEEKEVPLWPWTSARCSGCDCIWLNETLQYAPSSKSLNVKTLIEVPYLLFLGVLLSNAFSIPLILTLQTSPLLPKLSWVLSISCLTALLKSLQRWWDGKYCLCSLFITSGVAWLWVIKFFL